MSEEKKAIDILKEVASDDFDTLGDDISPKMAQNTLNVIEKQQQELEEYKKLVECIEEFKRLKRPVMELVHEMNKFEDEFISKDKIRKKIKELEQIKCTALTERTVEMMEDKINILNLILKEDEK